MSSSTSDGAIRHEIIKLEQELEEKKNVLFYNRLLKIANKTTYDIDIGGISEIDIYLPDENDWEISYIHHTKQFDENNYAHAEDSYEETNVKEKTTQIFFGQMDSRYYILTGENRRASRFKLYYNSDSDLRIINKHYDIELCLEEQDDLINMYCKCVDIPEWLALCVFQFICNNKWQSTHILNYFSKV